MKFGKYDLEERPHTTGTGIQCLKFFPNGYGASIVRFYIAMTGYRGEKVGSYGVDEDLWEMAVLKGSEEDGWDLTYDTPIANDVIGYLSEEEVGNHLDQIRGLKSLNKPKVSWWCKLGFHKWRTGTSKYRANLGMWWWLEECTRCKKTIARGKNLDKPFFTFVDSDPPSWEEFYGS